MLQLGPAGGQRLLQLRRVADGLGQLWPQVAQLLADDRVEDPLGVAGRPERDDQQHEDREQDPDEARGPDGEGAPDGAAYGVTSTSTVRSVMSAIASLDAARLSR